MAYQKIVQAGAGGNVGVPILNALVASNKFEITVLARPSSSYTPPANASNVTVVKADYSDHDALVKVFKGHDVLLITLGDPATLLKNSKPLIDAAIDAGIKRVVPSEYGVDLDQEPGKSHFIFDAKRKVVEYLKEKAAEGKITWTALAVGGFFDWGLTNYFGGFDIPNKKVSLFNGGTLKWNGTTVASIGDAVVGVLSSPETTKNKYLRVHDFHVSQLDILSILEEETNTKWAVEDLDIDALAEEATAKLFAGEVNDYTVYTIVKAVAFGKSSASAWDPEDDSRAVGLQKKDLREEIKKVL